MVSIVMPVYNAEKYLAESINSVICQTYTDWELLIVDDESSDASAKIIKEFSLIDARIKYFWQKNSKQGKARNLAINNSSGNIIAFLDADDVWIPSKLERQMTILQGENVDLVFGYAYLIENDIKTEKIIGRGKGIYLGESGVDFLISHDAYIMSTVLVKKDKIVKSGLFIEDQLLQYGEDWHLWIKLAFDGTISFGDTSIVSYYRLINSSVCAQEINIQLKLCNILFDLNKIYPNHKQLFLETKKRLTNVLYNSQFISYNFVVNLCIFMRNNGYYVHSFILISIFKMNLPLFRKIVIRYWKLYL